MNKVSGDLSLMPLSDLIQWADSRQKTGSLHFSLQKKKRVLYFEEGKIIFASSRTSGERLGEFLLRAAHLNKTQLNTALEKSKKLKIPFTSYLISEKIISKTDLDKITLKYAELIVTDALGWNEGVFEFLDTIPAEIINGPVKLETLPLVFESFRAMDESQKDKKPDVSKIIDTIVDKINRGDTNIPPIPDILSKLNKAIKRDAPIKDIASIIVTDQILTTSILKIANSPFFRQRTKVTSLSQAAMQLGIKAIKNMVTAHVLSGISAKDPEKVRSIMQHSLVCAFAARMIAEMLGENSEEGFICGLLHDIGKTVLINLISDYKLSDEHISWFLDKYHGPVGYAIASKWNLSDKVRAAARYHHTPEKAPDHQVMIELVFLADLIANDLLTNPSQISRIKHIDLKKAILPEVINKIKKSKDNIIALI